METRRLLETRRLFKQSADTPSIYRDPAFIDPAFIGDPAFIRRFTVVIVLWQIVNG